MENIYLDNAATCLVHPRVLDQATTFTNMLRDTTLSTSDVTENSAEVWYLPEKRLPDSLGVKPMRSR